MIVLVHGNDNLSSRRYFISQKEANSITFDAEIISTIELNQSLQGEELFGSSKKIFIENLFTRKGIKNISAVAKVLESNNDSEVYIWADKEIGVRSLSDFPKFDNQNFKVPQNIWTFLDGIRPKNPRNISSFHSALVGTEPEIVFAMIIRQFRLLLGVSSASKNNAEEIKKLAAWQRTKLSRQASLFDSEKLKQIYKKLYKIEKSQKTGSINLSLVQNIDMLLLDL